VTLALSLVVMAAALLGPSQTLAQTHRSSCPTAAHAKAKCKAHACVQSSHKGKAHHAAKCQGKHAGKKGPKKSARQALAPAYCEGGGTPVQAANGSFSCEDGSEPQCENGAIPTPRGKSLVCPVVFNEESSSSQAECEEEEGAGSCAGGGSGTPSGAAPRSGAGGQACEESSSEGSPSQCEAEG
jgi:hypothetical protein